VVCAILLLVGWIAYRSVSSDSITTDEIVHIPAGVSYLQLHDARMNPEHPPLLKVLAALPLFVGGFHLDYALPRWSSTTDAVFGEDTLSETGPVAARWIAASRVPMIAVMLLLAFTIFWMARQLAGAGGGFFALCIFASTPFFYAYGPLVHTDIGIALFALLSVWTFVSLWQTPDWPHTARFALCLAGALLSKFTSGLLLPCFVLLGILLSLLPAASPRNIRRSLRFSAAGIAIASVMVYLVYFVLFWDNDTGAVLSYRYAHSIKPIPAMQGVALFFERHSALQHLLSPPVIYSLGVGHTLHALPRTSYLLGKSYPHGTAAYFPTLFVYKMPLAYLALTLLLFVAALVCLAFRKRAGSAIAGRPDQLYGLMVLLLVFTCASLASPLNIGIRHFSVPIAVLTVLLALLVPLARRIPWPAVRKTAFLLLAVAAFGNAAALAASYPYFIPYFNPLVGEHPKFDIAIDSNLDWGQGLIAIAKFQKQHPSETLAFDVQGSVPAVYLPHAAPFDCENGVPAGAEWAAIGSTRFVSQPELQHLDEPSVPQCRNFFHYPYQVVAGGAVYIFHLPASEAKRQD
jgi:4-amino-4-deoxy-L-arabinose transferase-like glycosyltransferase